MEISGTVSVPGGFGSLVRHVDGPNGLPPDERQKSKATETDASTQKPTLPPTTSGRDESTALAAHVDGPNGLPPDERTEGKATEIDDPVQEPTPPSKTEGQNESPALAAHVDGPNGLPPDERVKNKSVAEGVQGSSKTTHTASTSSTSGATDDKAVIENSSEGEKPSLVAHKQGGSEAIGVETEETSRETILRNAWMSLVPKESVLMRYQQQEDILSEMLLKVL